LGLDRDAGGRRRRLASARPRSGGDRLRHRRRGVGPRGARQLVPLRGLGVALFETPAEFQAQRLPDRPCCLVLDVRLKGRNGLDFQAELRAAGAPIPIILMTGQGDIPMSVRAMKAGAVDSSPNRSATKRCWRP